MSTISKQHEIRKIGIDILQAGNYIQRNNNKKALENIANVISSLKKLTTEIKKTV